MKMALLFIGSALRLGTPLAFAALGGYCSERSGVVNIALEGMLLIGAFAAAAATTISQSPAVGLVAGVLAAVFLATIHSWLCIRLKADQVITGLAINLFALGISPVFCRALFGGSGGTPRLEPALRIQPLFGALEISPLLLVSFLCCGLLYFTHNYTRWGQYLRFAGEHPEALESQGIRPATIRWSGVLLSGLFCGLGGAYLSIDHGSGFSRNMTAGRGFIALAALIVGRWHPVGAFVAAIAFGAIDAAQIFLQSITLPSGAPLPVQCLQMLPYLMTLLLLAGVSKIRVPKALNSLHSIGALLFVTLALSGCDLSTAQQFYKTNIQPAINQLLVQSRPTPRPSASASPETPSDEHRRVNVEYLRELYQDVLEREARQDELIKFMNVLDQGATYEGIYNGIVYSREYKDREHGVSPVPALKTYVKVMAQILLDQKYDPLKIPKPAAPDVPQTGDVPPPQPSAEERQQLEDQLEQQAIMLSFYQLKRQLGEQMLKTIELKKEYREKLATWYGHFTVYLNKMGVDFGIPQRNIPDEYYHYKWALDSEEDRLKWECLNRAHRLMNAGHK